MKSPQTSSAASLNFFFSNSSRTNDFTTLIPLIFSCTELFKLSYFLNTFLNKGIVFLMTSPNPIPSTGIVNKKINASRPPIINPMTNEKINISGARTTVRIIII